MRQRFLSYLGTVAPDLLSFINPGGNVPISFAKVNAMIELTKLNGRSMMLNSDLIKTAEASPDTMLTLINGEKLIVREKMGEVVERILAYRARLLAVVAKRMGNFDELERAAGLAGIDLASVSMSGAPQASEASVEKK
jgi:flagellar protein FlbD